MDLLLALIAGLVGVVLVGPRIADEVQWWIGWRVVLPLLLGSVPPRSQMATSWTYRASTGAAARRYVRPITIVTGLAFAVAGLRFGWSVGLLPVLVLIPGLVAASTVDFVCWRIPARFVYLTSAGVLVAFGVAIAVSAPPRSIVGALIGAGLYLALLGGMHLVSPRSLGFGDVRLGGLIGLVVGWTGWVSEHPIAGPLNWTLLALMAGSLVGSVAGVVVLVLRRRERRLSGKSWREPYPYGPWLCVGGFLAILSAGPGV